MFSLFFLCCLKYETCSTYLKILLKMEHSLQRANASFSIIFSKVFKTILNVYFIFSMLSKIRNMYNVFENIMENGAFALKSKCFIFH